MELGAEGEVGDHRGDDCQGRVGEGGGGGGEELAGWRGVEGLEEVGGEEEDVALVEEVKQRYWDWWWGTGGIVEEAGVDCRRGCGEDGDAEEGDGEEAEAEGEGQGWAGGDCEFGGCWGGAAEVEVGGCCQHVAGDALNAVLDLEMVRCAKCWRVVGNVSVSL